MDSSKFIQLAKVLVYRYTIDHLDNTDEITFDFEDVYVVWACKTLQNNKALLSTKLLDGMYYEVTYNGDDKVFFFDAYKKFQNICIPEQDV